MKIKKHPFNINLFKEEDSFYISISKKINSQSDCLPSFEYNAGKKVFILPKNKAYEDMEEMINHIESFGALDNKLEYIDKLNVTMKWIPESQNESFLSVNEIKRTIIKEQDLNELSENWLWETVFHKNQLKDLYRPFSFFREGKLLFNSLTYQSSFCSFYMMLEYFFNEKGFGINNDAYKRNKCLKSSLNKCLEDLDNFPKHSEWLKKEFKTRQKLYDEFGLLSTINKYRDELSHASNKYKNRNPLKEHEYFSISFITMMVCLSVSIKMRILPFVHPDDLDKFLDK